MIEVCALVLLEYVLHVLRISSICCTTGAALRTFNLLVTSIPATARGRRCAALVVMTRTEAAIGGGILMTIWSVVIGTELPYFTLQRSSAILMLSIRSRVPGGMKATLLGGFSFKPHLICNTRPM